MLITVFISSIVNAGLKLPHERVDRYHQALGSTSVCHMIFLISVDICEVQYLTSCKCGVPLPSWGTLSVSAEVKIVFTPIGN
jgi:hypothetical protein